MHRLVSTSFPYRFVSPCAGFPEPSAREIDNPARDLRKPLLPNFLGGFFKKLLYYFSGCYLRVTEVQFIEPLANRVHGVHFQTFAETRFVAY